ncbi:MAG: 16S rRNA (uracil(1498)-N(3))-methyltransferase [Deltaproteobacteria bacterium]|nr:16S rRNA (uracil(1498)-N(3))-methyltransferase [Deltaproteobacteria bacterium]
MPRIFFPGSVREGELCDLGEQTLRYIKSVLRMKKGEGLILFDGAGWEYEAAIKTFLDDRVSIEVLKKNRIPEKAVKISLFQALPKATKMDFIVQKATELGADRIISFQSARTVPRLSQDKARGKISRWRSIAQEASRQCGRADIPEIRGIVSFEEMLACSEGQSLKIILWEEESKRNIKEILRDEKYAGANDISVVIGPEGGFSREEIERAADKGFISATMGKNILKVETAVLAILSIIQYEKGIFGGLYYGEVR